MLTLKLLRPLVALVLIVGVGSVTVAADSGGVVIKQAWARATAGSASTGGRLPYPRSQAASQRPAARGGHAGGR
jgi:hypothetical protein